MLSPAKEQSIFYVDPVLHASHKAIVVDGNPDILPFLTPIDLRNKHPIWKHIALHFHIQNHSLALSDEVSSIWTNDILKDVVELN